MRLVGHAHACNLQSNPHTGGLAMWVVPSCGLRLCSITHPKCQRWTFPPVNTGHHTEHVLRVAFSCHGDGMHKIVAPFMNILWDAGRHCDKISGASVYDFL